MPGYFHISTDGRSSSVLFRDTSEFVAGMNRIYFALASTNLVLLAFCLMDNHVHFVLYGEEDQCWTFIHRYKQLTGKWLQHHSGEVRSLDAMVPDVKPIPDQDYLMNVIIYDIMNPTKAFMPFIPTGYRWSSAGLYFADNSLLPLDHKKAGDFSEAQKRRLFGTKVSVPEDFLIGPDGMIWPGCYTDYAFVERLFGKPMTMIDRMTKSVEYQINMDMAEGKLSLPDAELLQKAKGLARQIFGAKSIGDLDVDQRISLARRLKITTKASYKQISRVVQMRYSDILTVFRQ